MVCDGMPIVIVVDGRTDLDRMVVGPSRKTNKPASGRILGLEIGAGKKSRLIFPDFEMADID